MMAFIVLSLVSLADWSVLVLVVVISLSSAVSSRSLKAIHTTH